MYKLIFLIVCAVSILGCSSTKKESSILNDSAINEQNTKKIEKIEIKDDDLKVTSVNHELNDLGIKKVSNVIKNNYNTLIPHIMKLVSADNAIFIPNENYFIGGKYKVTGDTYFYYKNKKTHIFPDEKKIKPSSNFSKLSIPLKIFKENDYLCGTLLLHKNSIWEKIVISDPSN